MHWIPKRAQINRESCSSLQNHLGSWGQSNSLVLHLRSHQCYPKLAENKQYFQAIPDVCVLQELNLDDGANPYSLS